MINFDKVGSSGILKVKQKLGVTFNSDMLDGIDFTKFSKLSMCSAAPWARATKNVKKPQNEMCESSRKA